MLFNQPAFLTVGDSFLFLMHLCAIFLAVTTCIGINSGSVLDAWFSLGRPYSCLIRYFFFLFLNIYSKENDFTFGDPNNDLIFDNLRSGGNDLTNSTCLAS